MSSNMDLAAKLAERIRTSDLGEWIDEDDLREIGKEALKLAFLKDTKDGYGHTTTPSLLVRTMEETFREQVIEVMKPAVVELCKDEDFIKLLTQKMVLAFPKAMDDAARHLAGASVYIATTQNDQQLQNKLGATINEIMYAPPPPPQL